LGGHDPGTIFILENGAGSAWQFSISQECLDSYDGPDLAISSKRASEDGRGFNRVGEEIWAEVESAFPRYVGGECSS
jgi:hypothetical protein